MLSHKTLLEAVCAALADAEHPPSRREAEAAASALDGLLQHLGWTVEDPGLHYRSPVGQLWSIEGGEPELIEAAPTLQAVAALFGEAGRLVDRGLLLLEQAPGAGLAEVRHDAAEGHCRLTDAAAGARDLAGGDAPC